MIKQLIKEAAKHTLAYWAYSNAKGRIQKRNINAKEKTHGLCQYAIDGFSLNLNEGHALPKFQREFAMYDRFGKPVTSICRFPTAYRSIYHSKRQAVNTIFGVLPPNILRG